MKYHIIAFSIGYILDLIIGDPYKLPHPIRLIGRMVSFLDKKMMDGAIESGKRNAKAERFKGLITVIIVTLLSMIITLSLTVISYSIHPYLGIFTEAVLTCYVLAAKSLQYESMKVYHALKDEGIEKARYAVSMIVGRDTDCLDEEGVTKATVETVAENTSDGVIAPMIYTCIGGPALGMLYKSINTMDSMIGYHNDRYESFGYFAAKLDDIVNFLPARISAIFMILTAFILSDTDGKNSFRIFKRDRYNHKSPNSAQTESACAGALGLRLAGDASYFGKLLSKPYIGDGLRPIEPEDIKRSIRLMYGTEFITFISCLFALCSCYYNELILNIRSL